jgi:hypothetical protein
MQGWVFFWRFNEPLHVRKCLDYWELQRRCVEVLCLNGRQELLSLPLRRFGAANQIVVWLRTKTVRVEEKPSMIILGCDSHLSWQQLSWLETETGETGEQKLRPLLEALQFALELGARALHVFSDSEVLVKQIQLLIGPSPSIRVTLPGVLSAARGVSCSRPAPQFLI